jgi:hypothetical protein
MSENIHKYKIDQIKYGKLYPKIWGIIIGGKGVHNGTQHLCAERSRAEHNCRRRGLGASRDENGSDTDGYH